MVGLYFVCENGELRSSAITRSGTQTWTDTGTRSVIIEPRSERPFMSGER